MNNENGATSVVEEGTGRRPGAPGPETQEREAARRRGELRAKQRAAGAEEERDSSTAPAEERATQRAFAALVENVRDYAIFLIDPQGVITQWGEGARLMKWWTKDEAEGTHLRFLYLDGGSEDGSAEAHLQEAVERGEYTGEGQRVRSDGSTFWAGVALTALKDDDGTLLGFAKITRDLTATHAAEEARRKAEEANRAKDEFLAIMSHELRTPLSAILGYVDLLETQTSGPLTDRQSEKLQRIRASGMHLLEIINEILDFSRLDAGRFAVTASAQRLGRAIESTLPLVQPQARAKGLELSDSVSGSSADKSYWGDEERVRQILVNLIANAIKFTPSGGRITISAGASQQPPSEAQLEGSGPWLYVRVEDTGQGIPAEHLEAIFEPFASELNHTGQHGHGGAGLGLSISRRLARLMGGDLTVRSEVGVGSSFFLWLPASRRAADRLFSKQVAPSPGSAPPEVRQNQ
ncbi:MAG TPA: ATP-binding protein [Thermoanaerobaculia bacterium]